MLAKSSTVFKIGIMNLLTANFDSFQQLKETFCHTLIFVCYVKERNQ